MKKLSTVIKYPLFLLFIFLGYSSCTKTNSKTTRSGTISFKYNGTTHVLHEGSFSYSSGSAEFLLITVDDPNTFKGSIYYTDHCAYYAPKDSAGNILLLNGCQVTSNLGPIDSSVIYLYQSGTLSATSGNCHMETTTDIFSGTSSTRSYCDIDGSFDLVLKNSENKTMSITEGKFHLSNN